MSGNLFYSLSTESRITCLCRISCVMKNRDSNWAPFSFGLNSPGSFSCRKPPQVHRPFSSPPVPAVPRQGEVGCGFQHVGHWQAHQDQLPSLTTSCSQKNVTVALATLPLGSPAVPWNHSCGRVKAYFPLPKAHDPFIAAWTGTAVHTSLRDFKAWGALAQRWRRMKQVGSPIPPQYLLGACLAAASPTSESQSATWPLISKML